MKLWLLAAAAVLASAGAATAQSCARSAAGGVRCRLALSEPRMFVMEAGARHASSPSPTAALVLRIDRRPCRAVQTPLRDRILARCTIALSAGDHVLEAAPAGSAALAGDVGVRLLPSARLAELPREGAALDPPRHAGLFAGVQVPFHP